MAAKPACAGWQTQTWQAQTQLADNLNNMTKTGM
jgi:hypothetical protein